MELNGIQSVGSILFALTSSLLRGMSSCERCLRSRLVRRGGM